MIEPEMVGSEKVIGGMNFVVMHNSNLKKEAGWLLDEFERMHNQGISLRNGDKIQFGWSFFELKYENNNRVVICEPDFSSNPFGEFRSDVSCTLQVQSSQNAFISKLGLISLEVSFQDKIVLSKNCLGRKKIFMERINPNPQKGDSGWFIGDLDDSVSSGEMEAIFVYQLMFHRPLLMQTLLLPVGYIVIVDGPQIETVLNPNNQPLM